MLVRALGVAVILSIPLQARAAGYVVRSGDNLATIARRYHVSMALLAHVNGIANVNLIQIGRTLLIPVQSRTFWYQVHWGDTLIGIAADHHLDISTIRSLNPHLGVYPLAGQWLRLCGPCSSGSALTIGSLAGPTQSSSVAGALYTVRPGDTLIHIAGSYNVSIGALLSANHLADANTIVIGTALKIPSGQGSYDPWTARSLIVSYAQRYGIEPSLPLAVGWQESGFNQMVVSRTGAVGVMQVEPYTGRHIAYLWGRPINLYSLDDNVHAGVYWLSQLLAYYGGNRTLAVAAYYQGTRSIARYGFFSDTDQYVRNVLALKSSFGG